MINFAYIDLEHQIINLSLNTVKISTVILVVFTLVSMLLRRKRIFDKLKPYLFFPMAITLVVSTLILFGSTVYLNVSSESKGPVHWHTDIEFWACNQELDLRNPTGKLSNKIGSSTFHEHNDKRIHLEGVVVRKSIDASLEKFMGLVGGYITDSSIGIPLGSASSSWLAGPDQEDADNLYDKDISTLSNFVTDTPSGKLAEFRNAQTCNDQPAELQVFVYTYNEQDKTYSQQKLTKPTKYVVRDEALVPPGDCVIVEFDVFKERTDKLCRQYGLRDTNRCVEFGVKSFDPGLCNLQQIQNEGEN